MPLPALLPALTKQDRGPPVGSVQKRKLRAEACDICRTHKRKCDGQRPKCGACVKRDSDCQYTESKARSVSRKYDNLRNTRSAHEELLNLMKTLPEQDAVSLFRSIRAGGDFGAILSHFRNGDLHRRLK